MTFDPKPSEDTVTEESKQVGWSGTFFNSLPKEISQSAFGNTTITVDETGLVTNSGATAGDVLRVSLPDHIFGSKGLKRHTLEFICRFNGSMPYDPDLEIGLNQDAAIGEPNGVWFDLTSEELVHPNQTVAFSQTVQTAVDYYGRIDLDYSEGETRVYLASENDAQPIVDATIGNTTSNRFRYLIREESNGVDQQFNMFWASETYVPTDVK